MAPDESAQEVPGQRSFDLAIAKRKIAGGLTTLRIVQGDTMELRFTADEALLVHLHGYNAEARLQPGHAASMRFEAYAAGRFPVEAHAVNPQAGNAPGHGITLLYVEVYPR